MSIWLALHSGNRCYICSAVLAAKNCNRKAIRASQTVKSINGQLEGH